LFIFGRELSFWLFFHLSALEKCHVEQLHVHFPALIDEKPAQKSKFPAKINKP
jgi:hypothetical protein